MKRFKIGFISLLLLFILTACNNGNQREIDAFHVFNKDENYSVADLPDHEFSLSQIIDGEITEKIALISKEGAIYDASIDTSFRADEHSIFFHSTDENKTHNIVGIYMSDHYYRNTDAYYDAKSKLDEDEKIMVVLLDGFGYDQYKTVEEKGMIPFLAPLFKREVLSVYTPVTNAGFAAMITGQTPDINGVHDRSFRQMETESIFGYAERLGKKSILLEGDIKILNTEIEPDLHTDRNKDGDTDDEMFQTAIKAAGEDYDFIFIHFHGIDDRGHNYGPKASETLDYIQKIDGYIEQISEVWNASIIITADHGMHETEDGGDHGKCIAEDMIVPYFMK